MTEPRHSLRSRQSSPKRALTSALEGRSLVRGLRDFRSVLASLAWFGIASALAFVALIALVSLRPLGSDVGSEPKARDLEPARLTALSLGELLAELRNRLAQEKVESIAKPLQGTLRLVSDGPLFALSMAQVLPSRATDARKIAEALAWAVRCHLAFGEGPDPNAPEPLQGCTLGPAPVTSSFARCMSGRGRVHIERIRFEGHSDSRPFRPGTRAEFGDNQSLSQARAQKFARTVVGCARTDLQRKGPILKIPFESVGLSASSPAELLGTDPRNRRIEVRFTTDDLVIDEDFSPRR